MWISRWIFMSSIKSLDFSVFDNSLYLGRSIFLFLFCSFFLYINIFYDKIELKFLQFNLMHIRGIILFNISAFIAIKAILFFINIIFVENPLPVGIPIETRIALLVWSITTNFVIALLAVLIGSVYRFMNENYNIKLRNEMLQRESSEARFANLKEQLNPHFLFNSFATLNGLIDESPEKAKKFVHDMSDVYRYVLKIEKVNTVSLKEEMEFANTYLSMVKERFGNAIQEGVKISEEAFNKNVLPFSVQMLIENAIKHNTFDTKNPLKLSIESYDACIEVKNSLKVRPIENKHSLGLYNLIQRYKYLSDKEVIIKKTEETFEVKIPFLP